LAHPKGKQSGEQTKSKRRKSISRRSGNSRGDQGKGEKETRNEDLAYATDSRLQKPKTERQHKSLLYAERGSIQGDSPHPHRVGEKRDQSQDRKGIGTEQTRQDVSDTDSTGRRERRRSESVQETFHSSECDSQRFPADYWLSEPDVGRVADGIPSRVDRLKGLGNAIVPQCAIVIMELIKQADAKPQ